ncbi:MAG: O-acetylhomoserine aminocarboxypropyltransferase/cysteine synthase [Prolixibacteraceae bacterium]|nr:O-acetylhomoserine aminocarboxypropyltransferase/cysteine synthase [Prolixibacteraceae bacterium]
MTKDLTYWIEKGKEMVANREARIAKAKKWKFDTIATHGLYDANEALSLNNGSIMEPVYLSPAQAYENSAEMEAGLSYQMPNWCYSRIANPTTYFLEETTALLETYGSEIRATCLATASGMSAIRTATDPFLVYDKKFPNPNIVTSAKVYGGTFQQFWVRRHQEQGLEVRWVKEPENMEEWENLIDENTRFVYGEFPSNPTVGIFDISEVAKLAHKFEIPLIVDATCASPALTRPLVLGADIVIQSASKIIGGSGTSIIGLLTAKLDITSKIGSEEMKHDFATWAKLWPFRDNGPTINPMASFMTLNDLRTLRMRAEKMSHNAMLVAQYLENHPKIERVHYPGLQSYAAYKMAKKYMQLADDGRNMFGYMFAVEIGEKSENSSKNSRKFYDALQMAWRATDLGRVKTVATLNAISTHQQQGEEGRALASIKPNTCRIACGIEHADDIIADMEQALKSI